MFILQYFFNIENDLVSFFDRIYFARTETKRKLILHKNDVKPIFVFTDFTVLSLLKYFVWRFLH